MIWNNFDFISQIKSYVSNKSGYPLVYLTRIYGTFFLNSLLVINSLIQKSEVASYLLTLKSK